MNTVKSFGINDEEIIIIAEMEINIDQLSEVRNFCKFYSNIVMENEPDVCEWKFFLNEEIKSVTLFERYRDSKALMNHGVNISMGGILEKHFQEFIRIFTIKSIKVSKSRQSRIHQPSLISIVVGDSVVSVEVHSP